MRYMLLIYTDEAERAEMSEAEAEANMGEWIAYTEALRGAGRDDGGRRAPADGDRDERARRRQRRAARDRRAVRRDARAARRLLPARRREPRRGDRVGAQVPGGEGRDGRAAARSWSSIRAERARPQPRGRRGRPLLPRGVRPRGGDPRPRTGRRRRPRRGGRAGRLRRRAGPLAARRRAVASRRRGSSRPPSGARSTGCGARRRCARSRRCSRASSRRRCATCPARTRDDPRRTARPGVRLLPSGARARGAGAADAAARRRPDRARDRARPAAARGDGRAAARAREEEGAALGHPAGRAAARRARRTALRAVLAVLYLVFNEGYAATAGDALVRDDVAGEAIRLARMVHVLLPDEPEPAGLLALMLLQHSRRAARVGAGGELVLLEDAGPRRWDRGAIAPGAPARRPRADARPPGRAVRAAGGDRGDARAGAARGATDWRQIELLYGELERVLPSPVVALNRAVAVAMADGPAAGLAAIDALGRRARRLPPAARRARRPAAPRGADGRGRRGVRPRARAGDERGGAPLPRGAARRVRALTAADRERRHAGRTATGGSTRRGVGRDTWRRDGPTRSRLLHGAAGAQRRPRWIAVGRSSTRTSGRRAMSVARTAVGRRGEQRPLPRQRAARRAGSEAGTTIRPPLKRSRDDARAAPTPRARMRQRSTSVSPASAERSRQPTPQSTGVAAAGVERW